MPREALEKNAKEEFESLSVEEMSTWLRVAAEEYFIDRRGPAAFTVFAGLIESRADGSVASELAGGYDQLSREGQAQFRAATARYVARLTPAPENAPIWLFLFELAWQVDAAEVLDALERRLSRPFVERLVTATGHRFVAMFSFLSNISVATESTEKCLSRLVECGVIPADFSFSLMQRLCQINPDRWHLHLALLREQLHTAFQRVYMFDRDTPLDPEDWPEEPVPEQNWNSDETGMLKGEAVVARVQRDLARSIVDIVGMARVMQGLPHLVLVRCQSIADNPTDDWFVEALVTDRLVVVQHEDPLSTHCVRVTSSLGISLTLANTVLQVEQGPISSASIEVGGETGEPPDPLVVAHAITPTVDNALGKSLFGQAWPRAA